MIGQDIAKRRLALGVTNHFKRLVDAWDKDALDPIVTDANLRDVVVEKSNILLIGPSGSGKTHLVKSLASYLNVPLVIGDATSLTEAGYVGEDVESLLSELILTAGGDIDAAQRGIVYIDEIDKIQRSGSGFKDMKLGVQHGLLKILEGSVATVPPLGGYKHPAQPGVPFDTTNVLFICGGAFVGLEDIIAKRLGRGGFGFGQMSENRPAAADGLLRQVKPEDLEQFGLISEIIGRLPVIAPAGCPWRGRPCSNSSIHKGLADPAVQETRPVSRSGPDVHRNGSSGDRSHRFGAWHGSEGFEVGR